MPSERARGQDIYRIRVEKNHSGKRIGDSGGSKNEQSEAVTNAIIHGYHEPEQKVELLCQICGDEVSITVSDTGAGIADVSKAMEPFYTTKPELERSGMGFSFMEAFMDRLEVVSEPGKGTSVHMVRRLGNQEG